MLPLESLQTWCRAQQIQLNEEQLQEMDQYSELLVEWNQKMNLTAITEPDEMAVKHFLDSLLLLPAANLQQQAKMIDVGTGAGFPAIPCAIARKDLQITLLDSLNKRLTFLTEVCSALHLRAECVHARAEEAGQKPMYREQYDIATARAVAHLRELSEYCLPFVKVGGYFVAMKGFDIDEELEACANAVQILGGKVEEVRKYELPDGSKRSIIRIRKISRTPPKYPRPSAKIAKFAL